MKKIYVTIFIFLFVCFCAKTFKLHAAPTDETNSEYLTYSEIILAKGKLLRDFTKEELEEYLKPITTGVHFYDVLITPINENIKGTYTTNTLFSVDNKSASSVEYSFSIQVETTNVVSFSASLTTSASASGTFKKVKAEASMKSNIEYSNKTTTSVKEKRTMDLVVEPNSRAIIYLMGEITITNGVFSIYEFFFNVLYGGYEFAILNTQYARLEKATIC